jgi:hypothetical protein
MSMGTAYVVGYTWVDGGGHESALSPTATITAGRALGSIALQVTIPALPTGVTGFHIYAVLTSGTTKRQAATTYVSSESVSPTLMIAYNAAGAAPPGASTFPTGTAALIKDAAGNTLIGSDDSSIYANKIAASTQTFAGIVNAPSVQTRRVSASISGTTNVTPDLSTGNYFAYTWSGVVPGTVTVNAPLNPPSASQSAVMFIDFTNTATIGNTLSYSWNGAYVSTATTLPASTTYGNTARMMFAWNGSKWLLYIST